MLVSRMTYLVLVSAVANARRTGSCYHTKGLCGPGVTDVKQNYYTFQKEAKKYGISVDIDYKMLSGYAVAYGIQTLAPVYMDLTNDDAVKKLNASYSQLQTKFSENEDRPLVTIIFSLWLNLNERAFGRFMNSSVGFLDSRIRRNINEVINDVIAKALIATPDLTLRQFVDKLKKVAKDLGTLLDDFMDDVTYNFAGGDDRNTALMDAAKWVANIDHNAHKSAIVNYPKRGFLPRYRRVYQFLRKIESGLTSYIR